MQQLAFKFGTEEIDCFYMHGAMYAHVQGSSFDETPIELGDKLIIPGQYISRLGEKRRTSFEMTDGNFLRYAGKSGDYLLFQVNDLESEYYYAFAYVSKNILMILNNGTGRDIRIESIEALDNYTKK